MLAAHALSDPNSTPERLEAVCRAVTRRVELPPNVTVVPPASKDSTKNHRTPEMWLAERTETVDTILQTGSQCPKSGDLYKDYVHWKRSFGEYPLTQMRWAIEMRKRFEKQVSNFVRYRGLRLLPPEV